MIITVQMSPKKAILVGDRDRHCLYFLTCRPCLAGLAASQRLGWKSPKNSLDWHVWMNTSLVSASVSRKASLLGSLR